MSSSDLQIAADALREGKLVAFPTETVYGLGADAMNTRAVERIFEVKGRPSNHPLIVHVGSIAQLGDWADEVPNAAIRLAQACWPGPLTLVLRKHRRVPSATTGGLDSLGLRVPAHPVALELLRRFGGGVAAPSANRFGRVSPTRAEHVAADLGAVVDVLLDGGECTVGVESTILDLTRDMPVLLRPGGVTAERIESILGTEVSRAAPEGARAPGMLASHYAPRARMEVLMGSRLAARAAELAQAGERVAVLVGCHDDRPALNELSALSLIDLGPDDDSAAQRLYASLRQADLEAASVILASPPAARGLGEALADRLWKAAGPRE